MPCDRNVDSYWLGLPNAIDAVVALVLDRRIPPAAEMDHMVCRRDCQAYAGSLGRQHHQPESWPAVLEPIDDRLPLVAVEIAIDDWWKRGQPEFLGDGGGEC